MKIMLVLAGFVLMIAYVVISTSDMAQAEEVLGIGTDALLGGDLTDPENDGNPEANEGYNAIFSSNDEPGFGGGEFSFNVFDNTLGAGNAKWCCGRRGGIPEEGLHVTAEFEQAYTLTHFTVSSANDAPERDPTVWEVQGSNDGEDWTTIFSHDGDSFWDQRLQIVLFKAGDDFDVQKTGYRFFRHVTFNTAANPDTFAYFQIGEIEYFGTVDIPGPTVAILTPSAGQIFDHGKPTITGDLSGAAAPISIDLTLNGAVVEAEVRDNGFTYTPPEALGDGEYTLVAEATDANGKTAEAIVTFSIKPAYPAWDVNEDGHVNILDLVLVGQNIGGSITAVPRADVNGDGSINVLDLVLVAGHFGESTSTAAPSAL